MDHAALDNPGVSWVHQLHRRLVRSCPGYWRLEGLWRRAIGRPEQDVHWTRVVMDRQTRRLVDQLDLTGARVLEISGDKWKDLPGVAGYESAFFPDYDVCQGVLPGSFDLIIAEQVFEHLLWPYRAARHVHQMLRPGGHFLITTPFLYKVHHYPTDCSRWTETGLKHFLAEAGFALDDIATGSWGNRRCAIANLKAGGSVKYKGRLHSLKNEPLFPVVVWALARKGQ